MVCALCGELVYIRCLRYIEKGWVESMGYEYMTASDKEELKNALPAFVAKEHEKPVVLEVFTKMKEDGEFTLSIYRELEKCIKPIVGD